MLLLVLNLLNLTGQLNTAVGYYAGRNVTSGKTILVGAYCGGAFNMTGHHNTGVGYILYTGLQVDMIILVWVTCLVVYYHWF